MRLALGIGQSYRAEAPHRAGATGISHERFREQLIGALEDPEIARIVARKLALPSFPLQGASCSGITSPGGTTGYLAYFDGSCDIANSAIFQSSGNVGIGTTSPAATLHVVGSELRLQKNDSFFSAYNTAGSRLGYLQWSVSIGHIILENETANGGALLRVANTSGVAIVAPNANLNPQTPLDVRGSNPKATTAAFQNVLEAASTDSSNPLTLRAGIKTDATATNRYGAIEVDDAGTKRTLALQASGGNVGIGTTTPQQALTLGQGLNFGTLMATPSGTPTVAATQKSGGTLSGTYYYKVTALDPSGAETLAGPESAAVNVTSPNNAVTVSWTAVTGASKYRVYRGPTSGGENVYNEAPAGASPTYTDTGTGTSGTPPTVTTALALELAASGISWFPYQLCAPPGGAFGLLDPGQASPSTVLYQGSSDVTILRTLSVGQTPAPAATLLVMWAPKETPGTFPTSNREATLTLQRASDDETNEEYLDLYNQYYPPPATNVSEQYGIRIQKRGTGVYRDFVFDQYDGMSYTPLMILKANTNVGIGNSSPNFVLHTSGAAVALGAPNAGPTDANLNNSNISFWLDETNNNLKVRVKYSNGTLKTATVALT